MAGQPKPVRRPSPVVRPGEDRQGRRLTGRSSRKSKPGKSASVKATAGSVDAEVRSRFDAVRGMSASQVKALQTKIGVNPDGAFGAGSRAALRAHVIKQRSERTRLGKEADAKVQEQRANAELAKARAEQARAEAARARVQQLKQKRLADQAEANRAGLIRIGSIGAGMAIAAGTDYAVTKFIGHSADSGPPPKHWQSSTQISIYCADAVQVGLLWLAFWQARRRSNLASPRNTKKAVSRRRSLTRQPRPEQRRRSL